jgi:hypothetical protein
MPAHKKTTRNADVRAAPRENGSDSPPAPAAVNVSATPASARQQDLTLQLNALQQADRARIFRDVGSGTIRKRPPLEACLEYLRAGGTLVVCRLDRLGRSLRHLVDVGALLEERDPTPASRSGSSTDRRRPDSCRWCSRWQPSRRFSLHARNAVRTLVNFIQKPA